MGERKVLNKYIPADFDPKLVPRSSKPKDGLIPVRMMLPFTIQCSTCSTFLYRGRKYNSKKEPVSGIEGKYLGIQRFRFYIKCSDCSRPITFLTDPKNADYEMETGGTRTYEVWHDESKTNAEFESQMQNEEKMDSMKALENRVLESQREMAELDALEEIRAMNQRHLLLMKGKVPGKKVSSELEAANAVLTARDAAVGVVEDEELNENGLTQGEEDLVKSIKFGMSHEQEDSFDERSVAASTKGSSSVIHRLDEKDELLAERRRQQEAAALIASKKHQQNEDKKNNNIPIFKVKRKRRKEIKNESSIEIGKRVKTDVGENTLAKKLQTVPKPNPEKEYANDSDGSGALSGLLGYGSESNSD